ncbi:hypothetical protein [Actibacterium pelagium]|uniref:Membrane protein n=1 Tax=Actibacterium pelagium TaxID=2029103 RepID=A0A917ELY7_9RHOB|nr:hypothetical protein [Actibacterium pelagium]GGE55078.1 membrane protein [Actibacterium pelagium]
MKRIFGALLRAAVVVLMVALPTLLLPQTSTEAAQVIALVAIFAAALTFTEYNATYPGIIEFRDAPPFNRIRFLSMMVTVTLLSLIFRNLTDPTPLTQLVAIVGDVIGRVIDIPYSPVHLVVGLLPEDSSEGGRILLRAAAGIAYLISIVSLALFLLIMRYLNWPIKNGSFNVWVNLPTFDPTAGGDVADRLSRDARFNVALGFLLPFLIPIAMRLTVDVFDPVRMHNPQTLLWILTAWTVLPTSLFMRGIAIGRIAQMIREQRRNTRAMAEKDGTLLAV